MFCVSACVYARKGDREGEQGREGEREGGREGRERVMLFMVQILSVLARTCRSPVTTQRRCHGVCCLRYLCLQLRFSQKTAVDFHTTTCTRKLKEWLFSTMASCSFSDDEVTWKSATKAAHIQLSAVH